MPHDNLPPRLTPTPGAPDHFRPDAPAPLVQTSREFIASAHWVWAKTFADFAPHWYTLRRQARPVEGYDALRTLIREHHYIRTWRGRSFRGVMLSGLTLWIMPDENGPDGGSILVNAKPAERHDWTPERPALFDYRP